MFNENIQHFDFSSLVTCDYDWNDGDEDERRDMMRGNNKQQETSLSSISGIRSSQCLPFIIKTNVCQKSYFAKIIKTKCYSAFSIFFIFFHASHAHPHHSLHDTGQIKISKDWLENKIVKEANEKQDNENTRKIK